MKANMTTEELIKTIKTWNQYLTRLKTNRRNELGILIIEHLIERTQETIDELSNHHLTPTPDQSTVANIATTATPL